MSTPNRLPREEPAYPGGPAPRNGWKLRRRIIGLFVGLASVLALGLVSPSSASAAVEKNVGKRCVGAQVMRCTWVNFDNTNGRFRAYGWIQDTPGARQYSVRVTDIQLVYKHPFRGFVRVGNPNGDYDGWHDVTDSGSSGLVGCSTVKSLPGRTVYAQAKFSWKGYSTGSESMVSYPVRRC